MFLSLYIHIPFCKKKCLYCDFYSRSYSASLVKSYVEALASQLKNNPYHFKTVYIGGGTPSILSVKDWQILLNSVGADPRVRPEFTIEANPESLTKDQVKLFLDSGVNRLSLGLQSFNDKKLKKLGRIHTASQGLKAIDLAKSCGFNNISADLIYGVWGETLKDWQNDLKKAVKLPLKHISAYALTCEENSPLYKQVKKGKIKLISDRLAVLMFKLTASFLNLKGFKRYEVSNFAKIGWQSRHNLAYWDNQEYLGLGPSAFSYIKGERYKNISSLEVYLEKIKQKVSPIDFSEKLGAEASAKETAAFKIRTKQGIDFSWFKEKTGYVFLKLYENELKDLLSKRLIQVKRICGKISAVSLTQKGFLFCDEVSAKLV